MARPCIGWSPSFIRCAAVSPAMVSGRHWLHCSTTFRSMSAKCRPAWRCSTGPCRRNGTSATPISRTALANGWSISAPTIFMWSAIATPINARMTLAELRPHLFSDPAHPDWIPYRTSYYKETWGFCLSHRQLEALPEDDYQVVIDSSLEPGHLTYGELVLRGSSTEEVLISCHVCHPSLANDNLSGIAVATALAQQLAARELRYTYRLLFIPGTIGAITWAALRQAHLGKIKHGFVLTCVGDGGHPTYKVSRRGNAEIDQAWRYVLQQSGAAFEILPFSPFGYDERQFCSPGLNLPVGCLMRTPHGKFPEYHTSADNPSFVRPEGLHDTLQLALTTIDVIENNRRYRNQKPMCEPRLGKYGLYSSIGGQSASDYQMALLWLLNMSDGDHTVLDIAERAALPWDLIKQATQALLAAELLKAAD
ncbi:MAG: DUF4910 domain-containing protein [Rhodopseudomonas palustris]|nr:DUF4910 domain-containing protein [Rhodopseudomonas palustris]